MEELEAKIQKQVLNFCKTLPSHVETWKTALQEAEKPTKALLNFAEQLKHVERANIKYMENFSYVQECLIFKILENIEEEIQSLKKIIQKLNNINHDLKNKLSTLERCTIDLDWESDSTLVKGNGLQPSLSKILSMGYDFWAFFANITKNLNETFRTLNVRNEKSLGSLENGFKLDLDNQTSETYLIVNYFLAITQYVINENAIC